MVELKKKVTLRTKTTEAPEEVQKPQVALKKKQPEPTPVPPTPPVPEGGDEPKGKWKKYAAVLAGLAVLGGGGYYLSQQGDDTPQTVAEVVEGQNSDAATTDGTTANQDGQSQEGDASAADAANESPAGDAPAVGGSSPADNTPSNATPSTPEQKKEDATSPATGAKDTTTKADAPAKGTPSKPVEQPKADIATTSTGSSASGTVEEEAIEVIRGKYGNGEVRKRNLGVRYAEIQSKVNEMYRNGLVN
jgi:hypothetical protein